MEGCAAPPSAISALHIRMVNSCTACISSSVLATSSSGPRFLLVFLRGGYDCANLLIPYSSSFYYEARPQIAIARPETAAPNEAVLVVARSL